MALLALLASPGRRAPLAAYGGALQPSVARQGQRRRRTAGPPTGPGRSVGRWPPGGARCQDYCPAARMVSGNGRAGIAPCLSGPRRPAARHWHRGHGPPRRRSGGIVFPARPARSGQRGAGRNEVESARRRTGHLVVRPLLGHSKSDLAEFARAHGSRFPKTRATPVWTSCATACGMNCCPCCGPSINPRWTVRPARDGTGAGGGGPGSGIGRRSMAGPRGGSRWPACPSRCNGKLSSNQLYQLGQPVDFELVESLRTRPDHPLPASPGHCLFLAPTGWCGSRKRRNWPSMPAHCAWI